MHSQQVAEWLPLRPEPSLTSEAFGPSRLSVSYEAAGISRTVICMAHMACFPFRGRWLPQGCWGLPILEQG